MAKDLEKLRIKAKQEIEKKVILNIIYQAKYEASMYKKEIEKLVSIKYTVILWNLFSICLCTVQFCAILLFLFLITWKCSKEDKRQLHFSNNWLTSYFIRNPLKYISVHSCFAYKWEDLNYLLYFLRVQHLLYQTRLLKRINTVQGFYIKV